MSQKWRNLQLSRTKYLIRFKGRIRVAHVSDIDYDKNLITFICCSQVEVWIIPIFLENVEFEGYLSYDHDGYFVEIFGVKSHETNPVRNFTEEEIMEDLKEKPDPNYKAPEWSELPSDLREFAEGQRKEEVERRERHTYTKPRYYGGEENVYEVIKIIEHYNLSFCAGNALKYLIRAGKKEDSDEIHDLNKGLWYYNREIQNRIKAKKNEDNN